MDLPNTEHFSNTDHQSSTDHERPDPAGDPIDPASDGDPDVLTKIKPPTTDWLKRLAELKAFLAVYDRYHAHDGPELGEHSANAWLSQQRHTFMAHTLTQNQAAAMDVLGDWITTDLEFANDTRQRQRLDELVDFQKTEHHLPSRRHFTSKHVWWQTQVSERNRGTMPARRLEAMNEAFPG